MTDLQTLGKQYLDAHWATNEYAGKESKLHDELLSEMDILGKNAIIVGGTIIWRYRCWTVDRLQISVIDEDDEAQHDWVVKQTDNGGIRVCRKDA